MGLADRDQRRPAFARLHRKTPWARVRLDRFLSRKPRYPDFCPRTIAMVPAIVGEIVTRPSHGAFSQAPATTWRATARLASVRRIPVPSRFEPVPTAAHSLNRLRSKPRSNACIFALNRRGTAQSGGSDCQRPPRRAAHMNFEWLLSSRHCATHRTRLAAPDRHQDRIPTPQAHAGA